MNEESFVVGADIVVSESGHWPPFHDAEVLSITLRRSPLEVELAINVFDLGPPGPDGFLERTHDSDLTLSLKGVADLVLEDWNNQNVLNSLQLERNAEAVRVALSGVYGVTLSCHCDTVEVSDLRPHS